MFASSTMVIPDDEIRAHLLWCKACHSCSTCFILDFAVSQVVKKVYVRPSGLYMYSTGQR